MLNHQLELNELKISEDYQRLVDAINAILCMDSQVEARVVTAAHQKLDQAIRRTNERLKSCDGLLQKGLRSEALQQAQVEPNLMDVIAILDFDEFELWNRYAQQCGFPRVPDLLIEVVDDLETAFADEEPLTDLRYRHRLHALARSPLPIRIDILRRLAKVDQGNPLWEAELVTYEKSRLADLPAECKEAAAAADLDRISALERELRSEEWRVTPSKKLLDFAAAKSEEIRGKFARTHLTDLEPRLNEAYALSDVETARTLREEWGRHAAVAKLSEKGPLMQKVREPLRWLAEKDRQDREQAAYQASVRKLEQTLDRKEATKADIEPLYYQIEQFGRGIPETLQQRVAIRVEELDREASRRRTIKWASFSVGTVVLLAVIGVGIFFYARSMELNRHVANLQGLIQDEQLDKAELYTAEMAESNPRIHEHPDFQMAIRALEQKLQEDEDRRQQLEYKLRVAQNTLEELSADNPGSLLNPLNQGYKALTDASEIAKTEMERTTISELGDELKKKETQVQSAVDAQFQTEVAEFHQSVKALDPDASGYWGQLNTQKTQAESLKTRKWISGGLGSRLVDPILTEIDTLIQQDEASREETKFLAEIRKAVGDPNDFRDKLNAYVNNEEFAGSPRRRDFQQVLDNETALWTGAEAWNEVKSKLKGANLVSYSPKYAPMRIAEARALLEEHKGFPEEADLKQIVDYLNLLVLRDQGKLLVGLEKNVLSQPIISDLYLLETKPDPARNRPAMKYYSTKPPMALGGTHYTIRFALNIALEEMDTLTVKKEEINNERLKDGQGFDFESPQMKFSRHAKDVVDGLSSDPSTWDRDFLKLLLMLHNDQKMDEFVKLKLYSAFETIGCAGSLYLKQQLQDDLNTLMKFEGEVDPNTNWIDPKSGSDDVAHKTSAAILRKMKDPNSALKGLDDYLKIWEKVDLGPQYQWVGWLHRDRKNQWTVSFKSNQPVTQTAVKLNVLTRGSTGPVSVTEIGEFKNGQVTISNPESSPALLQGRPVYTLQ